MKLRQIESAIQEICEISDFSGQAQIELEQYSTPIRLAAEFFAKIQDEIEDKVVVDLGCGCGILSAGLAVVGASQVFCVDIDQNCLDITKRQLENAGISAEFLLADIQSLKIRNFADVVVTNPPFGTRNSGIDWIFVQKALEVGKVVYSFHKSSTRKFFLKKKEEGFNCEVLMSVNFALPKMYKVHQKKSVNVEVDILRFTKMV